MNASTCTSPNDSVLLIEATVTTSHSAKKFGHLRGVQRAQEGQVRLVLLDQRLQVVPDRLADDVLP